MYVFLTPSGQPRVIWMDAWGYLRVANPAESATPARWNDQPMLTGYWPAVVGDTVSDAVSDTTFGFACTDGAGVLYVELAEARSRVWWAMYG